MARKRSRIDDFCDEISLPGLMYMKADYKSCCRGTTAILIVVCIGVAIYQMTDRIQWYIKNPLIFTENAKNEDSLAYLQFPTILVCNDMQMRVTHVGEQNQDVLEILSTLRHKNNGSLKQDTVDFINSLPKMTKTLVALADAISDVSHDPQLLQEYYNHMSHFGNFTQELQALEGIPNFSTQKQNHTFYEIKRKLQINLRNASSYLLFFPQEIQHYYKKEANLTASEREQFSFLLNFITGTRRNTFLQSCGWSWKCRLNAVANNLQAVTDFSFHKLATQSSQSHQEFIIGCLFKGNKACKINKKSTRDGVCHEILVESKLGEVRYSGRDNSMKILMDLENYKVIPGFPLTLGAKIYIRSPIGIDARGAKTVFVTSGSHWNIGVGQFLEKTLHKSQCGQSQLLHFDSYSHKHCLWEKETNYLVQECGCLPFYLPPNFKSSAEKPFCNFMQQISCFEKSVPVELHNDCAEDCFSINYQVEVTSTVLNAKTVDQLVPPSWKAEVRTKLNAYHRNIDGFSTVILPTRKKWLIFQHDLLDLWISFAPIKSGLIDLSSTVETIKENWPVNPCINGYEPAYNKEGLAFGCPIDQDQCDTKCREHHPFLYGSTGAKAACNIAICVCCRVRVLTEWDIKRTLRSGVEGFSPVADAVQRFVDGMQSHYEEFQNVRDGTDAAKLCRPGSSFLANIQNMWNDLRVVKEDQLGSFIDRVLSSNYLDIKGALFGTERLKQMSKLGAMLPSFFDLQNKVENLSIGSHNWFPEFQQFCSDLQVFLPGEHYDRWRGAGLIYAFSRENLAMVTIYFQDLDHRQIVQSLSYDAFSFLAEIGGTLGLYLGATVLVFYEILAYFIKLSRKQIIMADDAKSESRCRTNGNNRPVARSRVSPVKDVQEEMSLPPGVVS